MSHPTSIFSFTLLPKFVGVWQGDWACLNVELGVTKRFKATLEQAIVDNRWQQKNTNTYSDGTQDEWLFKGTPEKQGLLKLTSPTPPYDSFRMVIQEADQDMLLLHVWDALTGTRLALETICLVNPEHRVRTMHQFDASGALRGYMIINETKIANR